LEQFPHLCPYRGNITMHVRYFREALQEWNKGENSREMPWKGEKDPYKIWLSEIILQQTRVEQGWEYYERFICIFPTIRDLAEAPDERVFKLWEGLGYYSRCKNLLETARFIIREKGGAFPSRYEDILSLKGVGPYTAAAIASFAFGLPHAVVDGNVLRVLSRYFGISTPVDTTEGKSRLTELAGKCLDNSNPGPYNQALMDFGAVICKPANPGCHSCPLSDKCIALKEGKVGILPVKSKRIIRKDRYFIFLIAGYKGKIYVRKRTGKDIWENLFEFIIHEVKDGKDAAKEWKDYGFLLKTPWFLQLTGKLPYSVLSASPVYRQLLTHQQIHARFIRIDLTQALPDPGEYQRVPKEELGNLAFPRLLNEYLSGAHHQSTLF
jgi:A/G-specific adenine glycosylase